MKRSKMVKLIMKVLKEELLRDCSNGYIKQIAEVALRVCEENGMITRDYVSVSEFHLGSDSWDEE